MPRSLSRFALSTAIIAASMVTLFAFGNLNGSTITPARADDSKSIQLAQAQRTAPELTGISHWLNSKPLKISELRGKVVVVDFWTYGCINCIHALPHVVDLYEKYKNKGLVVIGVHSPEFPYERATSGVEAAIKRHRITYPVAQDNEFKTWNAFNNHYWPALYIIDQKGQIVFYHAGEGQYDRIEQTVRQLLQANS